MANSPVAPIYPGNGPSGGIVPPPPIVQGPQGGGDMLGNLPGLIIALQQMNQQRQENQKDREHSSVLTDKQLAAGADLRAAQAANLRSTSAQIDYEVKRAQANEALERSILESRRKYLEAQAEDFTAETAHKAKLRPLDLESRTVELDEMKRGIARDKANSINNTIASGEAAIVGAVQSMGHLPYDTVRKVKESVVGAAMEHASRFGKLREAGYFHAKALSDALDGDAMANTLTDPAILGKFVVNGATNPERLAGVMAMFGDYAPESSRGTVYKNSQGADMLLNKSADELLTLSTAGFRGKTADGKPADPAASMIRSPEQAVRDKYAIARLRGEAKATYNATDPGETPMGRAFNRLRAAVDAKIRTSTASPNSQDAANLRNLRADLSAWGVKGFAQRVMAGTEPLDDKIDVLASYRSLSVPARIALKSQVDTEFERLVQNQAGMPGVQTQYANGVRVLSRLKQTDPQAYDSFYKSLLADSPIKIALDTAERTGLTNPGLRRQLSASPDLASAAANLDQQTAVLQRMIDAMYGDINFDTMGMTPETAKQPYTWQDWSAQKLIDQAEGATVGLPPVAPATAKPNAGPGAPTAPTSSAGPVAVPAGARNME